MHKYSEREWVVCFARLNGWEGCECVVYDMTLIGVWFIVWLASLVRLLRQCMRFAVWQTFV